MSLRAIPHAPVVDDALVGGRPTASSYFRDGRLLPRWFLLNREIDRMATLAGSDAEGFAQVGKEQTACDDQPAGGEPEEKVTDADESNDGDTVASASVDEGTDKLPELKAFPPTATSSKKHRRRRERRMAQESGTTATSESRALPPVSGASSWRGQWNEARAVRRGKDIFEMSNQDVQAAFPDSPLASWAAARDSRPAAGEQSPHDP